MCHVRLCANPASIQKQSMLGSYPGDLNRMFERMITAPENEKYEPKVLSRPEYINDDTADNATYQLGPWMLVMENFVTDDEAER